MRNHLSSACSSCVYFCLNHFADFVIDTGWDGYITKDPQLVFDDWHDDWWKYVFMKVTACRIIPGEAHIFDAHKMVHECGLLGP